MSKKHETKPESEPKAEQQTAEQPTPETETKSEENAAETTAEAAPEAGKVDEQKVDYEAKYNELNDTHLRLMAEFDNYRKRMMRERADLIKNAAERLVTDLLPIVDDFERSLKSMESAADVAAVSEGVNLIYQKLMNLLKQQGVSVIDTENQAFDVEKHEAVTTIPAPNDDLKGKIIDCVQKGYQMNEKVIKFPKVVVGK